MADDHESTLTDSPEPRRSTEVTVKFSWYDYGTLRLDADGRVVFPVMPPSPGLYRLRFVASEGEWTRGAYIGEAVNLRARAQGYRTPGPTQKTNARVTERIRKHLAAGRKVDVALVTDAVIVVDGKQGVLDLHRKASRLLAENAAIHSNPEVERLENLAGIGGHAT